VTEPRVRDLGEVDEIDAEAIGAPGHRTFRLLAEHGDTTLSLWVEKEQLEALAVIIDQQVAGATGRGMEEARTTLTLASRFPGRPSIDFRAGRLAVGYDERNRRLVFTADELEESGPGPLRYQWSASRPQVRALSAKIAEIVAAGRPRCPLCGAPIEGKHVCPAANGHVH